MTEIPTRPPDERLVASVISELQRRGCNIVNQAELRTTVLRMHAANPTASADYLTEKLYKLYAVTKGGAAGANFVKADGRNIEELNDKFDTLIDLDP